MTANCHPQPPLQVYGEAIKHVTDFKYLGSQMASSASDFKRRKALAWGAFWKLERLWRSSELPISTKIKLFHTTCVTILLYGCESWVLSQDMECKINAFATSSYRVMLNIKRRDHVSNSIIYSMTDTQPLVHCVRKRQLSFLGHVLRLPEEEPVRRYAPKDDDDDDDTCQLSINVNNAKYIYELVVFQNVTVSKLFVVTIIMIKAYTINNFSII